MLAIEVEYLTGVARLANDRGDGADWPPQPDRLFSALVATWGARGERANERAALQWLEQQASPAIKAPPGSRRLVVDVYVPPNDYGTPRGDLERLTWFRALRTNFVGLDETARKRYIEEVRQTLAVIPSQRNAKQPRTFPAVVPADPTVWFFWTVTPDTSVTTALQLLCADTSYLGASASLVRCQAKRLDQQPEAVPASRAIYEGRLAYLQRRDRAERERQRQATGGVQDRWPASPGRSIRTVHAPLPHAIPTSVFGAEWIVFVDAGGFCPDAIAAGLATKALLRAVQAGYGPDPAPAWVSGHAADGTALQQPHLAAVPLLDVGWHYSQGRLMGLALILPRDLEEASRHARNPEGNALDAGTQGRIADEDGLHGALVRQNAGEAGTLEIALFLPGGREWRLRRHAVPEAKSLRPARYCERARVWATVTPIVLDRHPKAPGDIEQGIAMACERIGLPRPDRIVAAKHAAINGSPSAHPAARAPDWTGWRLPETLAGRRLTHAVLEFGIEVAGPVLLGAGRFVGFGLCLPLTAPSAP